MIKTGHITTNGYIADKLIIPTNGNAPKSIGGLNKAHRVIRTQSDLERINRTSDNISYKIERSNSQREERRSKRK